jgi:DNA-binding NarL/FixJ family response regulator
MRRDELSSRERQILDFLEQGHAASKIGTHLRISPRTVENHRAHILQKLKLSSATQLIRQVAVLDVLRASGVLD